MASSVPSTLALTTIADGSAIVAADHRNNYAAVQVGVNGLIALLDEADAKGDILIASGADAYDNLPVGTNGQVLTADSTQTLGVKWGTAPGTALICEQLLTGAQASFDTNTILGGNIPSTYRHLKIELYAREDGAVGIDTCSLRFNNDATAVYDYEYVRGSGGGTTANAETFAATSAQIGLLCGTTGGANLFSATEVLIPHYANALNNKTLTSLSTAKIGVAAGNMYVENVGGFWRNNAAITRITVIPNTGNFAAGTMFSLYGLT